MKPTIMSRRLRRPGPRGGRWTQALDRHRQPRHRSTKGSGDQTTPATPNRQMPRHVGSQVRRSGRWILRHLGCHWQPRPRSTKGKGDQTRPATPNCQLPQLMRSQLRRGGGRLTQAWGRHRQPQHQTATGRALASPTCREPGGGGKQVKAAGLPQTGPGRNLEQGRAAPSGTLGSRRVADGARGRHDQCRTFGQSDGPGLVPLCVGVKVLWRSADGVCFTFVWVLRASFHQLSL